MFEYLVLKRFAIETIKLIKVYPVVSSLVHWCIGEKNLQLFKKLANFTVCVVVID